MNESVLTKRVGNYRINIFNDDCPENPRTDWDNASHMVLRNRYIAAENDDVEGVMSSLCDKYGIEWRGKSFLGLIEALNEFIVIKPITVYTHSGSTVYYGEPCDRWDSGVFGFGYMEHEDLYSENCGRNKWDYPNWRDQCEAIMKGEMEDFDRAVRGEVYGFEIDELAEPSEAMRNTPEYNAEWWEEDLRNWTHYDSCGGYSMDAEEVMKEAESMIPERESSGAAA